MEQSHRPHWTRRVLGLAVRAAIAALLLGIIFHQVNVRAAGQALSAIALPQALAAAGAILLVGAISATKWNVLLSALDLHVPMGRVLTLTYIAATWNLALPGGESGNLVKAILLARQRASGAGAVWASMLVDQIVLVVSQLLVALGMLALTQRPPPDARVWYLVVACGLAAVLIVYLLFLLPPTFAVIDAIIRRVSRWAAVPRRLSRQTAPAPDESGEGQAFQQFRPGEWLGPLWQAIARYRGNPQALVVAAALGLCYYGTLFGSYWLAARGLGIPYSYPDIAWVTALAGIASLLPVTIFGLGVRESIIIFFLTRYGVASATALAFSLSILALNIVLGLPGLFAQLGQGIGPAPARERA
jgi:uncharacterized membrane protein YbhN (UPF0104 family)